MSNTNIGWISGELVLLDGTVTVAASSANVTGTNTLFLSQIDPGFAILIAGQMFRVLSITNDTHLVLSAIHEAGATGVQASVGTSAAWANAFAGAIGTLGSAGTWDYFDVIELHASQFVHPWSVIAVNGLTAIAGYNYQADTTGGTLTTITLPAAATIGDEIRIEDAALTWDAHNLTIARNGLKINSGTSDYTANVVGGKLSCVYVSASVGWSIK